MDVRVADVSGEPFDLRETQEMGYKSHQPESDDRTATELLIINILKGSFEGKVWREIFAASNRLTGLVTLLKLQWQIVDWSSFLDAVFSRCGLFLNAIIMRARRGAVSEIIAIRNGLFSWVVGGLTAAWVAPGTELDISYHVAVKTQHWNILYQYLLLCQVQTPALSIRSVN